MSKTTTKSPEKKAVTAKPQVKSTKPAAKKTASKPAVKKTASKKEAPSAPKIDLEKLVAATAAAVKESPPNAVAHMEAKGEQFKRNHDAPANAGPATVKEIPTAASLRKEREVPKTTAPEAGKISAKTLFGNSRSKSSVSNDRRPGFNFKFK